MPNQIMPNLRRRRVPMIYTLRALGLTSNLQLCIDAGDINSWPGSGQYFLDVSGNGANLTLGDNASNATNDPTFSGTPGRQSSAEFCTFAAGGGPWIWLDASSGWANTLHKDGAIWTFAGYWRIQRDTTTGQAFWSNLTSASNVGIRLGVASSGAGADVNKMALVNYRNFSGGDSQIVLYGPVVPDNSIAFVALSYNETTGNYISQVNATQVTGTQPYISPPSGNSTKFYAAAASSTVPVHLYSDAWWSRALSASELLALYNATKAKFGL